MNLFEISVFECVNHGRDSPISFCGVLLKKWKAIPPPPPPPLKKDFVKDIDLL